MDRNEFLKITWNKAIKPVMILLLGAFILRYIYKLFAENGTERLITIFALGFAFLCLLSYALGVLFSKALNSFTSKLKDKTRFKLRVMIKILYFIGTLVAGALLYLFFIRDWIQASILTSIFLVLYAIDIIKKEKTLR